MSLIPNTTCRRCHRQFPAYRNRCPYCGTKKVREVRSATPETDSAVPGTQAARSAVEAVNLQTLIGCVLLLAVIVATIFLVSSGVRKDVAANGLPDGRGGYAGHGHGAAHPHRGSHAVSVATSLHHQRGDPLAVRIRGL